MSWHGPYSQTCCETGYSFEIIEHHWSVNIPVPKYKKKMAFMSGQTLELCVESSALWHQNRNVHAFNAIMVLCVISFIWNMMLWLSTCVMQCNIMVPVGTVRKVMISRTTQCVRGSIPWPSVPVLVEDGPMGVCAQWGERLLCGRSVH